MNNTITIKSTGPLPFIAIILFIILIVVLIPLLILGVAGAAFSRLGFSWIEAVAVILLMLLGSLVNIPVVKFRQSLRDADNGTATVFDAFTGEPVTGRQAETAITLNVGGAGIPFAVSVFLLSKMENILSWSVSVPLVICLAIVAMIVAITATIAPEGGIRVSLILPALAAIFCGIIMAEGPGLSSAVTAFVGGTMGVLLGATAVALGKGSRTGVQSISIGGSGMFGPVFLCALLAAFIA